MKDENADWQSPEPPCDLVTVVSFISAADTHAGLMLAGGQHETLEENRGA